MKSALLLLLLLPASCTGPQHQPGTGPADSPEAGDDAGADPQAPPDDNNNNNDPAIYRAHRDLGAPPDLALPPGGDVVGPRGGHVRLLHFGVTGDTRPPACEDIANYPTSTINAIVDAWIFHGAQFGLDLGDHMYVCNHDLQAATAQMALYMKAVKRFGATFFMTMGNHECTRTPCLPGSADANYNAFMTALAPISNRPYYTFDVNTSKGLATFVVIADNAFDQTQAAWLEQTLARADQVATYTIVARHHPEGDTTVPTNATSMDIIRRHKFALFLSGHSHEYKHMHTDQGRDVVIGIGGAPLLAQGTFYGYMMIDQQPGGALQVTVYDLNSRIPVETWQVGPN